MTHLTHLIDDTSAGGVMRSLDFLTGAAGLPADVRQVRRVVGRHACGVALPGTDIAVSHLALTWRGLPGLMALRARNAGIPLIHVEHSYSEGFVAANVSARERFLTLLRTGYALFDHVVAVSHTQADWMRRRGLVPAHRLSVISPSVDLHPFRALPGGSTPPRRFACLGRFDRQKGFDLAIAAFRLIDDPELRLTLIGDGPEGSRLRDLAQGDTRIRFKPFASDPAEALRDVDCVLMPSRWEPFGLVALEAAAARRPVLASATDGLADAGRAGITPVRSIMPEAWAEEILRLSRSTIRMTSPCGHDADTRKAWMDLLRDMQGDVQEAGIAA